MTVPSLLLGDFHPMVGRRMGQVSRSPLKPLSQLFFYKIMKFVLLDASPGSELFQFNEAFGARRRRSLSPWADIPSLYR